MKNTLGDFNPAGVFSAGDLAAMQRAYEAARDGAGAGDDGERKQIMARAVLAAYQSGERDHDRLVEKALAASRGESGPAPTARLGKG